MTNELLSDDAGPSSARDFFRGLGPALKMLREKAGLSAAVVATRGGIGKSQLSKYEKGREIPRLESLGKILDVLGVEPLAFFYLVNAIGRGITESHLRVELQLMQSRRRVGGEELVGCILMLQQVLLGCLATRAGEGA